MHTMNNNLKDIHSHILYGIDDGSKTLEKSINMLEIAVHDGVSDIILTPHYIYESDYNCNNEEKKKRFAELQKVVKKKSCQSVCISVMKLCCVRILLSY